MTKKPCVQTPCWSHLHNLLINSALADVKDGSRPIRWGRKEIKIQLVSPSTEQRTKRNCVEHSKTASTTAWLSKYTAAKDRVTLLNTKNNVSRSFHDVTNCLYYARLANRWNVAQHCETQVFSTIH